MQDIPQNLHKPEAHNVVSMSHYSNVTTFICNLGVTHHSAIIRSKKEQDRQNTLPIPSLLHEWLLW